MFVMLLIFVGTLMYVEKICLLNIFYNVYS
jgi:hypothetical protein